MSVSHLRRASRGAAIVLLGLWPEARPPAESLSAETLEPLIVHGTPGHSIAHAQSIFSCEGLGASQVPAVTYDAGLPALS